MKQFVFVSGPRDHIGSGPRHDYPDDLRTLAYALEHSSNVKGVTTRLVEGQLPRDLNALTNASVIVLESSSEHLARETHALFPNNNGTDGKTYGPEDTAFLKGVDALVQKGMGVVVFHYTIQLANETAKQYFLSWLGGGWKDDYSTNPLGDWSIALAPGSENHPILSGVKPWTYHEEIFCKYYFPPEMKTTPLLIGTYTGNGNGNTNLGPQVAAFAYQRPGGGRAFVYGGNDYHVNLQKEDVRRFELNGLIWAAGMEVPAGGVQSSIPPEM